MSTEPRETEWTAVDITDHVQRFKLDGGELFIEKSAHQALEQKLKAAEIKINSIEVTNTLLKTSYNENRVLDVIAVESIYSEKLKALEQKLAVAAKALEKIIGLGKIKRQGSVSTARQALAALDETNNESWSE